MVALFIFCHLSFFSYLFIITSLAHISAFNVLLHICSLSVQVGYFKACSGLDCLFYYGRKNQQMHYNFISSYDCWAPAGFLLVCSLVLHKLSSRIALYPLSILWFLSSNLIWLFVSPKIFGVLFDLIPKITSNSEFLITAAETRV